MNIAILGGSFDPPHLGHQAIALQILEFLDIDEIWLMPVFSHPFNKTLSKPELRLEMTKMLEGEKIKVSEEEISQKTTSYSIDTLEKLSKKYKNHTFYWIIGSDQVKDFPRWKNWQTVIGKYHLIIFPRNIEFEKIEQEIKKEWKLKSIPKNVSILKHKNLVPWDISSSDIREKKKHNHPIAQLVSPQVYDYIDKHNLYK